MAATAHLPAHQPKDYRELPQGRKNWDKPPQQVKGHEGPEPHPTPEEAGAGTVSTKKKPQQVNGPEGPDPQENWPPRGHFTSNQKRVQQVDGPEGPDPTDGTQLIQDATATVVEGTEASPIPAKKAAAKTTPSKGDK